MIFLQKYIFDTILYKCDGTEPVLTCPSGNPCINNSKAKSTRVAKIEIANTQFSVCFETVFCAFYVHLPMRGLTHRPRYVGYIHHSIVSNTYKHTLYLKHLPIPLILDRPPGYQGSLPHEV